MSRSRHPSLRLGLSILGGVLLVASPLVGAIPGPGGIFVFAAGLALLLQNSHWAKRRFVHARRRWPRMGDLADRGLRRASARRRRVRLRSEGAR